MRKILLLVPILALLAGCAGIPPKPIVQGEESAGHYRPCWTWEPGGTVPATTKYRFRLDKGSWRVTTRKNFTPSTDLTEGRHLFEIQAGTAGNAWSATESFTTTVEFFDRPGYWTGVERNPARTQLDNEVVVCAHNTYEDGLSTPAKNLAATLDKVHAEQANDADAIELDIVSWDHILRVTHDDNGGAKEAAKLSDVLADSDLQDGDQLLFLEFKEKSPSTRKCRLLLDLILELGFATNGRPVVIRSFATEEREKNLTLMKALLKERKYIHIRPYIRLHAILAENQGQAKIGKLFNAGVDGVELKHSRDDLFGKLVYARALGMGTGVWSLSEKMDVAAFREEVDAIVVDIPAGQARDLVQKQNSLLYMNVWNEATEDGKIAYRRKGAAKSLYTNAAFFPGFEWLGTGEDRFGGSLILERSEEHSIGFGDLENHSGKGILVSMVVNFDELSIADGSTRCLLAKTDNSGYGLEIHNPEGWWTAPVLRFVVHVNGQYRYAVRAIYDLEGSGSYHIVAAYDGSGKVRLRINGSAKSVNSDTATGGITRNNSPLVLGADPQGSSDSRHHFSGKIQHVQVQRW